MKVWICLNCGCVLDPKNAESENDVATDSRLKDLPINWACPECGGRKEDFELIEK